MLNYANNKNAFIHKESNGRFGFKVASEILRHDQHTSIPGGRICEIRFFGLRTLARCGNIRAEIHRLKICGNVRAQGQRALPNIDILKRERSIYSNRTVRTWQLITNNIGLYIWLPHNQYCICMCTVEVYKCMTSTLALGL